MNIEEKYWFTNRQVISLLVAVAVIVFEATFFYFENQLLRSDLEVIEQRLDKKIKLLSELEDRIEDLEK